MSEAKTFMVEYSPPPIYAENFPVILKKFEHIMTMAKQGGVRFGRETVRERLF